MTDSITNRPTTPSTPESQPAASNVTLTFPQFSQPYIFIYLENNSIRELVNFSNKTEAIAKFEEEVHIPINEGVPFEYDPFEALGIRFFVAVYDDPDGSPSFTILGLTQEDGEKLLNKLDPANAISEDDEGEAKESFVGTWINAL